MQSKRKPIVVVGSINIDLAATAERIPVPSETIYGHDFQQHFGGKGANQAVAIARLGYPVEMVGKVGSDDLGMQARESLKANGVDVKAVEITEGSSGIAMITVSRAGQNSIVIVPGANAKVTPEYIQKYEGRIRNAGTVLAQLEIPLDAVAHLAHLCERYRVPLILDPAPAQSLPPSTFAKLAWFTPNETEAEFFARSFDSSLSITDPVRVAHAFLSRGIRAVALKLGARGVLIASSDGSTTLLPANAVRAVDTTAAGDAFNGAFATRLILGSTPVEAARFACSAAAISVTRHGAQPSMPSREDVEQLLREKI